MQKTSKHVKVFGKDFYAKESFDQHFMTDETMLKKIFSTAEITKTDNVLEIGPGNGSLTYFLVKKAKKVTAVEIDKELVKLLKKNLQRRNLEIINDNALKFIKKGRNFDKIVSNLPYMISEPLFMELPRMNFRLAAFTISESFAKIIIRDKDILPESRLNIIMNSFFEIKYICDVPKGSFSPPPRRKSCIIYVRPYTEKEYSHMKPEFIISRIFFHRKSKIKNALIESLIDFDKKFGKGDETKRTAKDKINAVFDGKIYEKKFNDLNNKEMVELYIVLKKT